LSYQQGHLVQWSDQVSMGKGVPFMCRQGFPIH
jgi:hypothetical protein